SGVAVAGAPFGEYHVLDGITGAVQFAATAGARGIPDVGWVVAAPLPAHPESLRAAVTGNSVQLSWAAPVSIASVTRYVLDVGSAPGLSNILTGLAVGVDTSFGASGVPPGTYYVRVRAGNYTGLSAPSNEVIVQVP
ncbi:MAG: fibronectin type III domain-containing protein, partial [Acidobacteriota bacterium]